MERAAYSSIVRELHDLTVGLAIGHSVHVVIKLSTVVSFFSPVISRYHGSFPAGYIISSRTFVRFSVHVFKNRANTKEDVVVRGVENSQAPAEEREKADERKEKLS